MNMMPLLRRLSLHQLVGWDQSEVLTPKRMASGKGTTDGATGKG